MRPWFVRRVVIFGPESTGKTTLARDLATAYRTVMVPEYARTVLEAIPGPPDTAAFDRFAKGQIASEDALARSANRLLFCDTDVLATTVWQQEILGEVTPWIAREAETRRYDLTLLTDVDIPWVADPIRFRPDGRRAFFDRCEEALVRTHRRYVRVHGDGPDRLRRACAAVDELVGKTLIKTLIEVGRETPPRL